MYALSHAAPFGIALRLSFQCCVPMLVVSPAGSAGVTLCYLTRCCPAFRSIWWSRIIMRPYSFAEADVAFFDAMLPVELSAAFAASSSAAMLLSVSVGAGAGAGAAAGLVVSIGAAVPAALSDRKST